MTSLKAISSHGLAALSSSLSMFIDDRSSRPYEDISSPELFILISISFDIYKNTFQIL